MIDPNYFQRFLPAWENPQSGNQTPNHDLINRIGAIARHLFLLFLQIPMRSLHSVLAISQGIFSKICIIATLSLFADGSPYRGDLLSKMAGMNNLAAVNEILERTEDPNIKNSNGQTALIVATVRRHEEMVKLLLDKGADPNFQDKKGQTALHFAAILGHQTIIEHLLAQGANSTLIGDGYTAAGMIQAAGYKNLGNILDEEPSLTRDWLLHKMMNHRFGLSIKIEEQGKKFLLSSFYPTIPYSFLLDSITNLDKWQSQGPVDWQEEDTQEVLRVIKQAVAFTDRENLSLEEKIKLAYEDYQEGKILLISSKPCFGHQNMIIFTPNYVIRGDRAKIVGIESSYFGLSSCEKELFKPGLLVQSLDNEKDVETTIAIILTMAEMPYLHVGDNLPYSVEEFFYKGIEQELNLSSPFHCAHSLQHGATCSWSSSAKLAFRGTIFARLLEKGYSLEEAKDYSEKMYKSWSLEDRETAVQEYINQVEESDTKTYVLACIYKLLTLKKEQQQNIQNSILDLIEKQIPDAVNLAKFVKVELDDLERVCRLEVNLSEE